MCYVHHVTPVQKPGKVSYTTCQLQTSQTATVKGICFSPEKTKPLKAAMENKSPIKIRKFEFNKKFNNVVIKNNTTITSHQQPLPFLPTDSIQTKIVPISSIKSMQVHELITVKANVTNLSSVKIVKTYKGQLKKRSATLVDPTGSVSVIFWEDSVDEVENDETYILTNLRVKKESYTGEIFVNTPKEFSIKPAPTFTEQLAEVQPSLLDITTKEINISIIGVKSVSSYFMCTSCGARTETSTTLVKCTS